MAVNYSINSSRTKLPVATQNMCAVGAGKYVYVFGGKTSAGLLDSIYRFDTEDESLTLLETKLPAATAGVCGVAVGNIIYLFNTGATCYIWKFNVTNETITDTGKTATGFKFPGSVAARKNGDRIYYPCNDGKIGYVYTDTLSCSTQQPEISDDRVCMYDNQICTTSVGGIYNIGRWIEDSVPIVGWGAGIYSMDGATRLTKEAESGIVDAVASVGDCIYTFGAKAATFSGGQWSFGDHTNIIQMYETKLDRATVLDITLPSVMSQMNTIAAVGEKIYIFGGYDATAGQMVDDILVFDTSSQSKVMYGGKVVANFGQINRAVAVCAGKKAVSDISITFDTDGCVIYGNKLVEVKAGQTATLKCAGKKMTSDVIFAPGQLTIYETSENAAGGLTYTIKSNFYTVDDKKYTIGG